MMTRKHYKQFADIIKDNTKSINVDVDISTSEGVEDNCSMIAINYIEKEKLINELSLMFKIDNSLFNKSKFVDACNERVGGYDNV
tara:strand:+ start:128 stop:382 length:255 start_codon:yes stop_codon:yes gene_type:complete